MTIGTIVEKIALCINGTPHQNQQQKAAMIAIAAMSIGLCTGMKPEFIQDMIKEELGEI